MNSDIAKIHQLVLDPNDLTFLNTNHLTSYSPVIKLGIQAPMGTKFMLNMPSSESIDNYKTNHEIEIGSYGIYELDLSNIGHITSLIFTKNGENVEDNAYVPLQNFNGEVLIDIVYLDFSQGEEYVQ